MDEDKLEVNDLMRYGDQLAQQLLVSAERNGLSHSDVIMGVTIALQLLRAMYPRPEGLFHLTAEAEGTLQMLLAPAGEPC